jgi:hypothetical protein
MPIISADVVVLVNARSISQKFDSGLHVVFGSPRRVAISRRAATCSYRAPASGYQTVSA